MQRILDAIPSPLPDSRRVVIAIAGPPASGKSTFAGELCAALSPAAGLLGMDAFHYDDQVLVARGDGTRKGAPHTFDVDGYANYLTRLRSSPIQPVAVPEFDRDLELSRNAASIVSADQPILITEGNYLLLDYDPWLALAPLFDLTVWLDVPLATVERRITKRWLGHGLDTTQAANRLANNDLPNAHLVQDRSRAAAISISLDLRD